MTANIAVIVAGGSSSRMGFDKQLLRLGNKRVIELTIRKFQTSPDIDSIIVVAGTSNIDTIKKITAESGFDKVKETVLGGKSRHESVRNGLQAALRYCEDPSQTTVLIHDGARPFVTEDIIARCTAEAEKSGAACVCVPAKDTIKKVNGGAIDETPKRSQMYAAQTPQAFNLRLICKLYEDLDNGQSKDCSQTEITDDSMLAERAGIHVSVVRGDYANIKLTTPEDIYMAEIMTGMKIPQYKIGIGQDSHRFGDDPYCAAHPDKKLILGGIEFEKERPLEANSDGDVVFHALTNAISGITGVNILGGAADIMCSAGVTDSREYLREALKYLKDMRLSSVSFSIECLYPKLAGKIDMMKKSIAEEIGTDTENVGITATTGEGLTEFGKGRGIQVFCVATAISV